MKANIKQDSKSFFAYIRSKQKVKDVVGPLKDNVGLVITKGKEMADALNIYFSSVFTLEDKHVDNTGYDSNQDKKLKDNKSPAIVV